MRLVNLVLMDSTCCIINAHALTTMAIIHEFKFNIKSKMDHIYSSSS